MYPSAGINAAAVAAAAAARHPVSNLFFSNFISPFLFRRFLKFFTFYRVPCYRNFTNGVTWWIIVVRCRYHFTKIISQGTIFDALRLYYTRFQPCVPRKANSCYLKLEFHVYGVARTARDSDHVQWRRNQCNTFRRSSSIRLLILTVRIFTNAYEPITERDGCYTRGTRFTRVKTFSRTKWEE